MEGSEEDDDRYPRPRGVNVIHFVKERVRQIAELIQAVDNRILISGEVSKGPRTAVQRLPRHMRRRAMSYNIKRFPRMQRRFAFSAVSASKRRQKPPSRFWRRRPRNLLLIIGTSQAAIIELLHNICAPEIGPTFAFKTALDGRFEMSVMLYEPRKYPRGFIAPARFLWSKHRTDEKYTLAVWIHPSSYKNVLSRFTDLLKLRKKDQAMDLNNVDKIPCSIDEWRLHNLEIKTDVYVNDEDVKLLDLSDQVVRFRLYGPKSFEILREVLAVVEENELEDSKLKEFISSNQWWKNECSKHSPGELPDGFVVSLLVEDPRLSRPLRKTKPTETNGYSTKSLNIDSLPPPLDNFWNFEIRRKALEKKLTETDLQKIRNTQLQPVKTSAAKIPILVIVRNTGTGTTSPFIGLDLIIPSGFGLEFWLALQYGTARSIGLKDQKFLELESSRFNFPADVPDCDAGLNEFKEEYINLQEKYLRCPHNRRIKYWSSLSIKYPFTFQFSELSHDWLENSSDEDAAYVIRDRRTLLSIEKWLIGRGPMPEKSLMNSAALVPVSLVSTTLGRPQRFALICAPIDEDFMSVTKLSKGESVQIIEQPRTNALKSSADNEENKEGQRNEIGLEDFISLDVTANEKHISLNSLFPDKEMLRKRKMKEKKKEKREKAKAAKRLKRNMDNDLCTSTFKQLTSSREELKKDEVELIKYSNSCSRPIIGRIVRGDYSFVHGRGFAIGYCCLPALKQLRHGIVLFRNVTSRCYNSARITLLKNQVDL
ncbi:unnamed protein product [Litomosoides sigmodontis]|uniref:POPLD domain-containing protein n=1 Tax=Litomosoides sigmodontis TaxID=42156 RepID=A0A3P6UQ85_LITSI|nr:unnamed protein product [Litomosoides sigmodontis]